jgi:hypothetical protein
MKNLPNNAVFDLVIIGNGIAAQSFLWNLQHKTQARNSQNFSIAHVYSEKIAPACSLKTSSTVSLNGIDEDVSPLGNDMRKAYFLFENLVKKYSPEGVEEVPRVVISTNDNDTKKLTRRYKALSSITSDKIKNSYPGIQYPSYVISPGLFLLWLKQNTKIEKTTIEMFVKNMEKVSDLYQLTLEDGSFIQAKKVLFATGAFSKIFEKFHAPLNSESIEIKNTIKAGSYLERQMDLGPKSFYISIDGHQALYRKNKYESTLIIGSATTIGAYEVPDLISLSKIFSKMKDLLAVEIGQMSDFKIVTGLRHKGPKRMLLCEALDENKTLFRINGLYKNGFTMAFLAAEKMAQLLE